MKEKRFWMEPVGAKYWITVSIITVLVATLATLAGLFVRYLLCGDLYCDDDDDWLRGMAGNQINVHLCPNSNITLCPEHLQQMIAAMYICSLLDDEDLTNKIMRRNFDQAILRETVINHPLRNGNGNVTNTIV